MADLFVRLYIRFVTRVNCEEMCEPINLILAQHLLLAMSTKYRMVVPISTKLAALRFNLC